MQTQIDTIFNQIYKKKKSGGACPQTLLGRDCADGTPPPPPPASQLTTPPHGQPWVPA